VLKGDVELQLTS